MTARSSQNAPRPLAFALDAGPGEWAAARKDGADAYRRAVDRTIALARIAEQAGITSFWAMEDPDGWDAFAVLGAVARATERIQLGTGVTNPYYRHPSLIAASIATLDALSDGRAFLGFGRGQAEWYQRALGIAVGRPLRALAEAIDLFHAWWRIPSEASSPDTATEFHVDAWKRGISPVQPRIPIYLAAVGPQALRLAGRKADGVLFNDLASRHFIADAIETVRASARAAGRDPDALRFVARAAVTITDDPEALYERRKATVAIIHALPGMERLLATPGYDIDAIIGTVRRVMRTDEVLARGGAFADLREAGDLEAAKRAIPTDLMRELVIAGPASVVRNRLAELQDLGVTDVVLAQPGPDATVESLSALLDSIAPDPR
ncbi:MAG: LLM class flavin-dependent oxidoreductase [Thermomicrobiales bacterium]